MRETNPDSTEAIASGVCACTCMFTCVCEEARRTTLSTSLVSSLETESRRVALASPELSSRDLLAFLCSNERWAPQHQAYPPFFEQSLSMAWSSPCRLAWLTTVPKVHLSLLYLLGCRLQAYTTTLSLLWVLGTKHRPQALSDQVVSQICNPCSSSSSANLKRPFLVFAECPP